MRTFTTAPLALANIRASDLWEVGAQNRLNKARAVSITIYDEAGVTPEVETAEALYLPNDQRLGIAWGADATWADATDLEAGIEMWLNNADAWDASN